MRGAHPTENLPHWRTTIKPSAVAAWHTCVQTGSTAGLDNFLAEEVVFYSPVVHTPQRGKKITALYLAAAIQVFGNDTFRYVKEVIEGNVAVLEFEAVIDQITINGVDIVTWNSEHKIVEFKVMVRPLQAINLLHQKMAAMLESMK